MRKQMRRQQTSAHLALSLADAMDSQSLDRGDAVERLAAADFQTLKQLFGQLDRLTRDDSDRTELCDKLLVAWGRNSKDLRIATGLSREQWLDVLG